MVPLSKYQDSNFHYSHDCLPNLKQMLVFDSSILCAACLHEKSLDLDAKLGEVSGKIC